MYKKIIYLISFFLVSQVLAQPLPSDSWVTRHYMYMIGTGEGWVINNLFKPIDLNDIMNWSQTYDTAPSQWIMNDLYRYAQQIQKQEMNEKNNILIYGWTGVRGQSGISEQKGEKNNWGSLYSYNHIRYKNFNASIYFRAASDPDVLPGFTPHSRDVRRLGMNSGEFDQAILQYRNNWLTLQFGRGRQVWGPDYQNNLLLTSRSAAYDHFMAGVRYKQFQGTFFTGFLESVYDGFQFQNRYIVGHGIQYSDKSNFLLSLSEITVYYGPDRSLDLAYLNPILPHLEVELNDRGNCPYSDKNYANSVWIISTDWLLPYRFRVSGSFLIDEIQFDQEDREQGRTDALAYNLHLSKSFVGEKSAVIINGGYDHVGTYTFRHENPYTSFVSRELPLGIPLGSDFYRFSTGVQWITPLRMVFSAAYNYIEQGENNVLDHLFDPYSEFIKIDFPSGMVTQKQIFSFEMLYSFRPSMELKVLYDHCKEQYAGQNESWYRFLVQLKLHYEYGFTF